MTESRRISRRRFLAGAGVATVLPWSFRRLAAAQRKRVKIRDVQVMMLQGGRTYTLVKITADDGLFGIAEAYGRPGVGVKEQVLSLKPWLVGKDPLEIDTLYTQMGEGSREPERDAHRRLGAQPDARRQRHRDGASGISPARSSTCRHRRCSAESSATGCASTIMPRRRNMLDKASVAEWAAKVKAHPSGFTCHKFGFPHSEPATDPARDPVQSHADDQGADQHPAGVRELPRSIGWDHDIMVHCHWEYDLRTSIQIADAVESIKPLWLEDPLPVDYTDSWKRLCAGSKVPICMGENLARREGFKDFILNQGCDILHPDLRNSGGFLETKRIADLAHIFGMPMATHNTGSQVNTYADVQWAASIRDYMSCETVTGEGGWMDQVLMLDGPYIKDGFIQVTDKPGTGHRAESRCRQGAPGAGGNVVGMRAPHRIAQRNMAGVACSRSVSPIDRRPRIGWRRRANRSETAGQPLTASYQYSFTPNCICRGEFACDVICPKLALLKFCSGAPQTTRLKRLNTSARTSRRSLLETDTVFATLRFSVRFHGRRTSPFILGALPSSPTGWTKAARSRYRSTSGSNSSPAIGARQSAPVVFGRLVPLKIGRGAALVVTPIGSPLA